MILHYRCILLELSFSPFQTKVVELLRLDSASRDSDAERSYGIVDATSMLRTSHGDQLRMNRSESSLTCCALRLGVALAVA